MGKQKPLEIIHHPNTLKVKVGGALNELDPAAIRRAEDALEELQGEMQGWLMEELDQLNTSHIDFTNEPMSPEKRVGLYMRAHDLKGLGSTYGFPLVGRFAGSLCVLMTGVGENNPLSVGLVDAHINAIKVIVRDEIKEADNPVGIALATELETQVAQTLQ